MIWNKEAECMSREQLRELQGKRLRNVVENVYKNTPFYRRKMDEIGVKPEDINSIDDITKLPFTTKTDLRDNYPFGLCAVPMKDIVRVHASSGTTGKPTVVGYTRNDLEAWADCLARSFTAYGATKNDFFHISYGYGLFTGGLGAHYGAEKIGASVIPMSSGNTDKQILLMHDFGSSVLCCTPSYALFIADKIKESGYPRNEFKLKIGAFGAEPWTEQMRTELQEKLGIKAYDIYGLSEIAGPGVGFECENQNGTHLNEDHYFPEIINPVTFEPMKEGETGELVFTHLTKEGMPLLRYRTKDLTALHFDKCSCGRTLVRMDRILGRSDDMMIIRGVNVFPSQIESVILKMDEFAPQYKIFVDRINNLDIMEVWVEVREEYFTDELSKMLAMKKKLSSAIHSVLGIAVDIKLVEPNSIERSEGKAKRVFDKRIFK
ncbi:MAG: phenylacetate--CoA ligase [Bacteroidales bacterium]|nr:phenylacetate--CoA ligase [Bacteroidales bacterium]